MVVNSGPGIARVEQRSPIEVHPLAFQPVDDFLKPLCSLANSQALSSGSCNICHRTPVLEVEHLAKDLKQMAVLQLIQLAEVDGHPVGLSITLPNINEAIQPLRDKLTIAGLPIGLMRLAYRLKKVQTGRLAVLGVVPGYRRRGVAEALIQQTFHQGFGCLGYRGAELGWTLEDNVMVNRMIERVGGRWYKTYRIYRKNLQCSADSETTRSFRMRQTVSSSTPVRQSA